MNRNYRLHRRKLIEIDRLYSPSRDQRTYLNASEFSPLNKVYELNSCLFRDQQVINLNKQAIKTLVDKNEKSELYYLRKPEQSKIMSGFPDYRLFLKRGSKSNISKYVNK